MRWNNIRSFHKGEKRSENLYLSDRFNIKRQIKCLLTHKKYVIINYNKFVYRAGVYVKPKSINSLIKYMRDKKGIAISGSTQKKKLRYMGYFHGYKGYRYCYSPSSLLPYTGFNELQAVYEFDMSLKAILYPQIMFLETTIKNYALENILKQSGSERFADIYTKLLNDYKTFPVGSREYKESITKRMNVRNKIYSVISRDYGRNNIVNHYYDKDKAVPIWAIFELLSLGEFGNFLSCVNVAVRKNISGDVGIKSSVDSDGKMLEKIVYTLKDLRNSVAHNNTVFDTRFKTGKVNNRISKYIMSELSISNVTFDTIVDYIVLIAFVMSLLKCPKTQIQQFIHQFEDACDDFRKNVPANIYSKIIYTDTKAKLTGIKNII